MSDKEVFKLTMKLGGVSFTIGTAMLISCGESELAGTLLVGGFIIMSISFFNLIVTK